MKDPNPPPHFVKIMVTRWELEKFSYVYSFSLKVKIDIFFHKICYIYTVYIHLLFLQSTVTFYKQMYIDNWYDFICQHW